MSLQQDDSERLEEVRNDIRSLQAEYSRKREDLEKKEMQKREVREKLAETDAQLADLADELELQKRVAKDVEGGQADRAELAVGDFMIEQVQRVLRRRVPLMSAVQGLADGADADPAQYEGKEKAEDQQKSAVHDTVLVSYVNAGAATDDFQVAYRIDSSTSVEMLHRDACIYWGCSHNDYCLCIINGKEEVEPLWEREAPDVAERKAVKLQSEEVLNPAEKAQLHLVNWEDLAAFKVARQKLQEQEQKMLQEMQAKAQSNDAGTIKTLKHGYGIAVPEKITEPFVDALKPWPGVHSLLKHRDRHVERRWARIRFADFVCFGLLMVLTCVGIGLRSSIDQYALRTGVVEILGEGAAGSASASSVDFSTAAVYSDMWAWLAGTFHTQLFKPDSSLRRFYTPMGFVRLRQQRAMPADCPDRSIPLSVARSCYSVDVSSERQQKQDLTPSGGEAATKFIDASANAGWRSDPDPFTWHAAQNPDAGLYGVVQYFYDGSGYSMEYDVTEAAGNAFLNDLDFIRQEWTTPQTRFLVAEVTLANYNLGGFVSANFLFEIAPSGAIRPTMDVLAFKIYPTPGDEAAAVLDVFRWIIVIGYIALLRLCIKTKEKKRSGRYIWRYVLSFGGLIDATIVALFCAAQYFTLKGLPPDPTTLSAFYSYSHWAHNFEMIAICEAFFLQVLILRCAMFARMSRLVYRIFKLFARSFRMFCWYLLIFVPVLFGSAFLANTIWSPYVLSFSTWALTVITTLMGTYQPFSELVQMYETGRGWTIPFLIFFFMSTTAFLLQMFLAIAVHNYFEVELVEGSDWKKEQWSTDQWLDWALWAPVFTRLTGHKPGVSRKAGYAEAEEGSDSGSDSSDEDDK